MTAVKAGKCFCPLGDWCCYECIAVMLTYAADASTQLGTGALEDGGQARCCINTVDKKKKTNNDHICHHNECVQLFYKSEGSWLYFN